MTIDEAISHAKGKAEEIENEAEYYDIGGVSGNGYKCAAEHRQLAEWLKELKRFREGRKRVKWIKKTKTIELNGAIVYDSVWICPNCGTVYDGGVASNLVNYCYCCGAKMSGGEQE